LLYSVDDYCARSLRGRSTIVIYMICYHLLSFQLFSILIIKLLNKEINLIHTYFLNVQISRMDNHSYFLSYPLLSLHTSTLTPRSPALHASKYTISDWIVDSLQTLTVEIVVQDLERCYLILSSFYFNMFL
jgi:hypothetical protein